MTSRAVREQLEGAARSCGWTVAELRAFRAHFFAKPGTAAAYADARNTALPDWLLSPLSRAIPRSAVERLRLRPVRGYTDVFVSKRLHTFLVWWTTLGDPMRPLDVLHERGEGAVGRVDWFRACALFCSSEEHARAWMAVVDAAGKLDPLVVVLPRRRA